MPHNRGSTTNMKKKTPVERELPTISRGLFLATVALQDEYNTTVSGYILENETFKRLIVELAEKESISQTNMDAPSFLVFKSEGARDVYVFAESTIANMNLYDLVAAHNDKNEQRQTH